MTTPSNPLYREIPLTQGKVAIVDADNYDWLSKFPWHVRKAQNMDRFYAVRKSQCDSQGRQKNIWMHREVLGLKAGDKRQGDHIKIEETLLNTRENLRIATICENQHNKRKQRNNTSGFKGVTFRKSRGTWRASICCNGTVKTLGYRKTPEEAYELYKEAAIRLHGDFARVD